METPLLLYTCAFRQTTTELHVFSISSHRLPKLMPLPADPACVYLWHSDTFHHLLSELFSLLPLTSRYCFSHHRTTAFPTSLTLILNLAFSFLIASSPPHTTITMAETATPEGTCEQTKSLSERGDASLFAPRTARQQCLAPAAHLVQIAN